MASDRIYDLQRRGCLAGQDGAREVVTVSRLLRRRLGRWLTAALFGRSVADLGRGEFWPPGFGLPCPAATAVETVPTPLARRLRVGELSDAELRIADYTELAIDHNSAYSSPELMRFAVDWLKAAR